MATKLEELQEQCGGYWQDHPDYSFEYWRDALSDGETRQGYWEWVEAKLENKRSEDVHEHKLQT